MLAVVVRGLSKHQSAFLFDCCVFIARFTSSSCYSSAKTRIRLVKSYHFSVILDSSPKMNACLHVSFTAYENFYKLSKMHCLLVLTFHFPIFRMSECRNPTIKHIFTYTLISPFISTYMIDLFLVILFT